MNPKPDVSEVLIYSVYSSDVEIMFVVVTDERSCRVSRAAFEIVWARIVSLEGEPFTQILGQQFEFEIHGNLLQLSTTNQAISRSQMEAAYELAPLQSTTSVQHLRAPSYIYAILMDPRVRRSDW
jgi:hypothetical protein